MMGKSSLHTLRSILMLAGAFTFAFLLGEMTHDTGHYLSHLMFGNRGVRVHFDPFGGTHISGAGGLPVQVLGVTSAAGPLANLAFGLVTFTVFWHIRRPLLMPVLLWGPVAMVQEGVTFSLGLLTPGGDAAWMVAAGLPQGFVLGVGILLLAGGVVGVSLVLPLVGIRFDDPVIRKLVVLLAGFCSLMAVRAAYSIAVSSQALRENTIPLVFSILLVGIVLLVQKPARLILRGAEMAVSDTPNWSETAVGLVLGAGIFLLQIWL